MPIQRNTPPPNPGTHSNSFFQGGVNLNHLLMAAAALIAAVMLAVVWRLKYSPKAKLKDFDKSKVDKDEQSKD